MAAHIVRKLVQTLRKHIQSRSARSVRPDDRRTVCRKGRADDKPFPVTHEVELIIALQFFAVVLAQNIRLIVYRRNIIRPGCFPARPRQIVPDIEIIVCRDRLALLGNFEIVIVELSVIIGILIVVLEIALDIILVPRPLLIDRYGACGIVVSILP